MDAVLEHKPKKAAQIWKAIRDEHGFVTAPASFLTALHAVPEDVLQRDVTRPHVPNAELVDVLTRIYQDPEAYWREYETCEELVDIEESFQLWRFRHMRTVERIIGYKAGTGGSSGVAFLKRTLDLTFFPELYAVRTGIGAFAWACRSGAMYFARTASVFGS